MRGVIVAAGRRLMGIMVLLFAMLVFLSGGSSLSFSDGAEAGIGIGIGGGGGGLLGDESGEHRHQHQHQHQNNEQENSDDTEPWQDGETIIRAFHRAYPDRVQEVAWRKQDWALRIDDTWFYWMAGKLLPEEALTEAERYSRYPFYPYSAGLPVLRNFSESEVRVIEERVSNRERSGIGRHPGILDMLWKLNNRASADRQTKTLYFLGMPVTVHRNILEDLARVEERVLNAAEQDAELTAYISFISRIAGYTWRNIAASSNRSLHSYGIALDFIPRSYDQSQVYWLWARASGLPWYNLAYEDRFMPPASFVRAFEEEGFIWGGKWLYFDTIHFEYRPEILIINGLLED